LQFEPLDFLDTRLGVASWGEGIGDIRPPANDFLILVVVEDGGNLYWMLGDML
jgi:hypothetical protein